MLIAIAVMGCATVENTGLSKAVEWTLAKPCHKHAGRARGTRINAQAGWSPRAYSGLSIGSIWVGNGNLLLEQNCALTPLLMQLLLHLNKRSVGFLRDPNYSNTIIFPWSSLFLFKIPMWILLCFVFKLLHIFWWKKKTVLLFVLCLLPSSLSPCFILWDRQTQMGVAFNLFFLLH